MPKLGTATLTGASGETYTFNVYNKEMRLNDFIPGVYLISRQTDSNDPAGEAIYIGESDNVDRTLQSHDKKACFEEHKYDRICLHRTANPETRKKVADDLVKVLAPSCND